ncbi:MAG: hypothetical protein ACOY46_01855 [Bacillota bacterium]
MLNWISRYNTFIKTINVPLFGAGFIREGVDIGSYPNFVSFDGTSVYFFGLTEKEASRLLDGITMLNGYTGWLSYILQEIFFDETFGDELYGEIFDGLGRGIIKHPSELSRESLYLWVEDVAPAVEEIKRRLEGRLIRG